jgi:hypothetical protein
MTRSFVLNLKPRKDIVTFASDCTLLKLVYTGKMNNGSECVCVKLLS